MATPSASVIMINRNGGDVFRESLKTCRQSLQAAWESDPCFEMLVIDNGSTDDSLAIAADGLEGSPFPWRVVEEPTAGVNFARNAGLAHANGELLVFTDSDLRFDAGWLQAYLQAAAAHPAIEVFAGRVKVGDVEGEIPPWLDLEGPFCRPAIVVQMNMGDAMMIGRLGLSTGGPVGPNMAFRRSAFDRMGWFDTRFGLRPGSLVPGAEAEFVDRLGRAGLEFVYVPGAVVYHPLRKSQISKAYFLQRLHGIGRVHARLQRLRGVKCKRLFGITLYAVEDLVTKTLKYWCSIGREPAKERFFHRGELSILLGHLHEDVDHYLTSQRAGPISRSTCPCPGEHPVRMPWLPPQKI